MSTCSTCGKTVPANSNFCAYCGAPLSQPAAAPARRLAVGLIGLAVLVTCIGVLAGSLLWMRRDQPVANAPAAATAVAQGVSTSAAPGAASRPVLPAAAPGQPLRAPAIATPSATPAPRPTAIPTPTPTGPPRVSAFHVCAQPCDDTASNASHTFPGGISELFIQWDYENIPPNAHYVRTWTVNGKEWIRYDCHWTTAPSSGRKKLRLWADDKLGSGDWEISIFVDDKLVLRDQIVLTGNAKLFPLKEPVRDVCSEDSN